jgi:hypothetical protein
MVKVYSSRSQTVVDITVSYSAPPSITAYVPAPAPISRNMPHTLVPFCFRVHDVSGPYVSVYKYSVMVCRHPQSFEAFVGLNVGAGFGSVVGTGKGI